MATTDPKKKSAAKAAVIGNIANILAGKTKASNGKAKAAGNLIFSNCNNRKTNGKAITVASSQEAITLCTKKPILAAPTRATKCLLPICQLYEGFCKTSKKTTITGGIAAICEKPKNQTPPTQMMAITEKSAMWCFLMAALGSACL